MNLFNKHISQREENDCGVACLQMILQSQKYYISYLELKEILRPDISGISINKIIEFLSTINVATDCYIVNDKDALKDDFNKKQFPCMALLERNNGNHFIVIYKITKNKIIYSDPEESTYTISKSFDIVNQIKYIFLFDFSKLKQTNNNPKISKLFYYFKNKKMDFLKVSIVNIIASALSFTVSLEMGSFLDKLKIKNILDFKFSILYLFLIFLVCIISKSFIDYINGIITINLNKKIENDVYKNIEYIILNQHYDFMKSNSVGDVVARISEYILSIRNFFSGMCDFLSTLFILIFSLIWMICINGYLSFIVVISICINIFIIYHTIYKYTCKQYLSLEKQSHYNKELIEILDGFDAIKMTNSEEYFLSKINSITDQCILRRKSLEKYSISTNLVRIFVLMFFEVTVYFIGTYFVKIGLLSNGQIATFGIMLGILQSMSYKFVDFYINYVNYSINFNRINQIINFARIDHSKESNQLKNVMKIEFANFNLFYDRLLIENDTFTFFSNFIIIKGDSGSGKSSLVRTIAELNNNYDGRILINGIDLTNYAQEEISKKIIYLSNNDTLFTGSIIDNICLGKKILKKTIIEICKDCQILDDILKLPNKFDYYIRDINNSKLSTGQKQRISLVRALLLQPEILILDEALSNIDLENRNKIIEALKKYNCMKIIVTHDNLLIKDATYFEINNKKMIGVKTIE